MRSLPFPLRISCAFSLITITALLAGCGGGTGSSSSGGSGGSSGTGGSGGATTSGSIPACPVNADPHVAATILGPDGKPISQAFDTIAGTIEALGIDTPPTAECGSGEAWVQIKADTDGPTWIGCFQAPNLVLDAQIGDSAEIAETEVTHDTPPYTRLSTLKVNGALVVEIVHARYETEAILPGGMTMGRADSTCASLDDPCQKSGYNPAFQLGEEVLRIPAGESGDIGGYRVYVDRYWVEAPPSACGGAEADIRLSITPSPSM